MKDYNIEPYNETNSQQNHEQEEAYLRAKKKLEKIMGFYWHLAIFILVNTFLIILIYTKSGEAFFSFAVWSTPIFWGIGLLFHFLGVFGPNLMFGKEWEQRKINEILEKEDKQNNWK